MDNSCGKLTGSSQEAYGKLAVISPSPSASHHRSLVNPEQIASSSPRHAQPSVKELSGRRCSRRQAAPGMCPGAPPKVGFGLVGKPNCEHCLSRFPSALEMDSLVINLQPPNFAFLPLAYVPSCHGRALLEAKSLSKPPGSPGRSRLAGLRGVSTAQRGARGNVPDPSTLCHLLFGISQGRVISISNRGMSGVSVTLIISAPLLGMLN